MAKPPHIGRDEAILLVCLSSLALMVVTSVINDRWSADPTLVTAIVGVLGGAVFFGSDRK